MKVLVVGATGNVGSRASVELFRSGEVDDLHLAARDADEARTLASRFSTDSRTTVTANSIDLAGPDVSELFAEHDVIVNCAGPGYALESHAVAAAVAAEVHYVSLCDDHTGTEAAQEHDVAASASGISVISGCGLSPGITNFLIDTGAAELDDVKEVHAAVAASSADSDGYAAAQHLVYAFAQDAPFLSEGEISSQRAGSAPRLVYFPEPVGWVETFACGHPEISTIPRARPGLRTMQFRLGLTERVVMDLIRGSRAIGLLRTEATRNMWLAASWRSRAMVERIPPRGASWTAARVDIHGSTDGTAAIVSLAVVDHLVNLASVAIKEAALALGRGEAKVAGVRGAEEILDSTTMLERLSQRGIRAARLESDPV